MMVFDVLLWRDSPDLAIEDVYAVPIPQLRPRRYALVEDDAPLPDPPVVRMTSQELRSAIDSTDDAWDAWKKAAADADNSFIIQKAPLVQSPDGSTWAIVVDDLGNLSARKVPA